MTQPIMTTNLNGTIRYHLHGELHREDGPAVTYADGKQYWYLHGEIHREDGPATIWEDGSQFWYINGKIYDFDDYCKQLKLSEEVIVFLKLKYNTCIVA